MGLNVKSAKIVIRFLERHGLEVSVENAIRYSDVALRARWRAPRANAGGFGDLKPNTGKRVAKTAAPNKVQFRGGRSARISGYDEVQRALILVWKSRSRR